ncbi:ZIP Zinc transporter [Ophiocordyceps sinensis CO18]|uniref:ZIP Zinc transporter n=1 Tax=Ophiocordyceps sinensis (strain Co18 / CGMCC 3.14243) TaxID=911162 RepID=T5A5R6_OPHSC|nr:ZIP Zinc transporter [Ophiocordyceps sinensis CO18]
MTSLLILFVVDMCLNAKTGGHSHGGPFGELPGGRSHGEDEVESHYEKKVAPRSGQMLDLMESKNALGGCDGKDSGPPDENLAANQRVYKKMSTNITLLECGILFHSIFVGMAVAMAVEGFVVLLVAIMFHQVFEGLGLGSRIAAVPYPEGSLRPWLLVLAFGLTGHVGQAIGLVARNSYDAQSTLGLIMVGVFNAISAGLLIYATLIDLLAEDFLSEEANMVLSGKDKAMAFCWVLAGATGMSIVGAFT